MSIVCDPFALVGGPAYIGFEKPSGGTVEMYSVGAVSADRVLETKKIETCATGVVDEKKVAEYYEVTFQPAGWLKPEIIACLFPYLNCKRNQIALDPAGDLNVVICGDDGKAIRFKGGFVTQMPQIRLGCSDGDGDDLFGDIKICFIGQRGTAADAPNRYFQKFAHNYAPPPCEKEDWILQGYEASWGGGAFGDLCPEGQVIIDLNAEIEKKKNCACGYYTALVKEVRPTAKFSPLGVTVDDFCDVLDLDLKPGQSILPSESRDLVLTGLCETGITFTLFDVSPAFPSLQWDCDVPRIGEVTFTSYQAKKGGEVTVLGISIRAGAREPAVAIVDAAGEAGATETEAATEKESKAKSKASARAKAEGSEGE